ncbi:PAPA-1-like conserved region family protein [Pochonia chlamydosporia 170]|uniref:PAPA-1-like conserved region family protein n=1 Tax=Pochonia chlamydosporia 170 TaxID=1380566 RepID=A0A179G1A0_METCM|nr:PAPA-1-like conserved region family protein [Pochonia chlamydosporia 170]OAQ71123.1 PAPA-1-like conserved region family protein [Pochonia chlamydosporia 170]
MASRPRRSAAARANESISVHAKWADTSERSDRSTMASRRSGRASGASALRDLPSSPDESVTVKTSSRATRGANRRSDRFDGGEIVHGTRNRGGRKNYVIDSSPDDDEEEEEEGEEEDAEGEDIEDVDADAEGEEMEVDAEGDDVDAEGEEDAEGDINMDLPTGPRAGHTIRVSQPAPRSAAKAAASKMAAEDEDDEEDDDDDDDDELSDPMDSDEGDQTMAFGDETMADEDAEGEEIEVAGEDDEEEEEEEEEEDAEGEEVGDAEADSDEGTREGTPDLTKMTKRQRARFEEEPQEYMKLSDEVQVKKHFTAEELSMRRQEMARRRRNLSEKRTEEVKMETINKLLKKQAPKINRKAAAAAARADSPSEETQKADPTLIRWVNNRSGSKLSVPEDIIAGPAGQVFSKGNSLASGKMVQEVA